MMYQFDKAIQCLISLVVLRVSLLYANFYLLYALFYIFLKIYWDHLAGLKITGPSLFKPMSALRIEVKVIL